MGTTGPRISTDRLRAWKICQGMTTRGLTARTKEVDPDHRGVSYNHLCKILQGQNAGPRAARLLLAVAGPDAHALIEDDQVPPVDVPMPFASTIREIVLATLQELPRAGVPAPMPPYIDFYEPAESCDPAAAAAFVEALQARQAAEPADEGEGGASEAGHGPEDR